MTKFYIQTDDKRYARWNSQLSRYELVSTFKLATFFTNQARAKMGLKQCEADHPTLTFALGKLEPLTNDKGPAELGKLLKI